MGKYLYTCGIECPSACWYGPENAGIWCDGNGSSGGCQRWNGLGRCCWWNLLLWNCGGFEKVELCLYLVLLHCGGPEKGVLVLFCWSGTVSIGNNCVFLTGFGFLVSLSWLFWLLKSVCSYVAIVGVYLGWSWKWLIECPWRWCHQYVKYSGSCIICTEATLILWMYCEAYFWIGAVCIKVTLWFNCQDFLDMRVRSGGLLLGFACSSSVSVFDAVLGPVMVMESMWCGVGLHLCLHWLCLLCLAGLLIHLLLVVDVLLSLLGDLLPRLGLL